MEKDENPFLNPEWLKLQRQYFDALRCFGYPPDEKASTAGSHEIWGQMLESWWRSVSPGLPDEYRASFNHVLRQSRAFHSTMDQFARMFSEAAAADKDNDEWQTILSRYFESMRKEAFKPEYFSSGKPGINFLISPLTIWQQIFSGMPHESAGILKNVNVDDFQDVFQSLFTLPGVDQYSMKYQEKIRDSMKLWEEYCDKSREYHVIYEKLGISALDLMEKKILELGRKGGQITGLRELYNLWIDCNEKVFSEYMEDEDYSKRYSELLNILIEIKVHYIELMDEIYAFNNIPTARTMDTVYKAQHTMNRELSEARKDQEEASAEIEKLRKELEILRKQLSTSLKNKEKSKKVSHKKD